MRASRCLARSRRSIPLALAHRLTSPRRSTQLTASVASLCSPSPPPSLYREAAHDDNALLSLHSRSLPLFSLSLFLSLFFSIYSLVFFTVNEFLHATRNSRHAARVTNHRITTERRKILNRNFRGAEMLLRATCFSFYTPPSPLPLLAPSSHVSVCSLLYPSFSLSPLTMHSRSELRHPPGYGITVCGSSTPVNDVNDRVPPSSAFSHQRDSHSTVSYYHVDTIQFEFFLRFNPSRTRE